MGNQPTKELQPISSLKRPQRRTMTHSSSNPPGQTDLQRSATTVGISTSSSCSSSSNSNTNSRPNIKPVRHQVILSDYASPLPSLSASLSIPKSRLLHRRRPKPVQDTLSVSSASDEEPDTPSSQSPWATYSSSVGSSVGSSSCPVPPTTFHASQQHHHRQHYQYNQPASSTMIVFDSAIAIAENAAADLRKRRIEQDTKSNWVYDYGQEKELDRQLRQHYVLKQVFGGNLHVTLESEVNDILETACGTGLWALEIARDYPKCNVIGMDIIPPSENGLHQRHSSNMPSNLTYAYGDVLAPLIYSDNQFDLVFQRDVANVVPLSKWSQLISEFYRVLKPGGQVELIEYDLLFKNTGPVLALVNEWYEIAAARIGTDPRYVERLPSYLKEAGFEQVQVREYDIPIGEWPDDPVKRQYGYLYKEQMKALFKSMKRWWLSELEVSQEQYDQVCASALEEFEEYHSIAHWKIMTAKKPV